MTSPIFKRSIVVDGHKTSVSLEDAFWRVLKDIAHAQRTTLSNVVSDIDRTRQQSNLSSAIRLFVLDQMRIAAVAGSGHAPLLAGRNDADSMIRGNIETRV